MPQQYGHYVLGLECAAQCQIFDSWRGSVFFFFFSFSAFAVFTLNPVGIAVSMLC